MSSTLLITGANGFIGTHLVKNALDRNFRVMAIVRPHSDTTHIQELKIDILRVDYGDVASLTSSIMKSAEKIDLVIHCAGVTEAKDTQGFFEGNVKTTANLMEALKNSKRFSGKFVLLSSLAARGPMHRYRMSGKDSPITTYGRSKLEAEELVKNSGLDHLIVRPTAVYGPRDTAFLELVRIIDRGWNVILGNRDQKLTMIHAHDLSQMIFDAMMDPVQMIYGHDGGVYRQADISDSISAALGKRRTISIRIPKWLFYFMTIVMNRLSRLFLRANWTYTREKADELTADDWSVHEPLNYPCTYDLKTGFLDTVQWYRSAGWIR